MHFLHPAVCWSDLSIQKRTYRPTESDVEAPLEELWLVHAEGGAPPRGDNFYSKKLAVSYSEECSFRRVGTFVVSMVWDILVL